MSDQRPDEDRGAHRPQVIDLDAEEIRTEAEAPKPEGPQAATADETPPPPPFKPVRRRHMDHRRDDPRRFGRRLALP